MYKKSQPHSAKNFSEGPIGPYCFVLKEGSEIKKNLLDYSLMLLQVSHKDVVPSPKQLQPKINAFAVRLLKIK